MRVPTDDYYARLGVSRTASPGELRRAYRLLALRWHPDRAGSASTEVFQRISEAYQVLSDAGRRAAYDGSLGPRDGAGNGHGTTPGEIFGPGGRITWRTHQRLRGARIERLSGALADLVARGDARRALDGSIVLLLTRAEAGAGGLAAIDVPLTLTCPTCGGVAAHHRVWCRRCEYAGEVVDDVLLLVDIPRAAQDGAVFSFAPDPLRAPVLVRVQVV
jgi:molecular chaperone DnaJ